jgi:hypothetical protein
MLGLGCLLVAAVAIRFPGRQSVEKLHRRREQHQIRAEAGQYRWKRWRWGLIPAAVLFAYLAFMAH